MEKQLKILEQIRKIAEDGQIKVFISSGNVVYNITEYVPTIDRNELVGNLEDDIQKLKDMKEG
jgi:hypothetical protein